MKLGNIELANPVMLAPMAGVTDLPYRMLAKEQGCGYMITEMVSAKAITYHNKNTQLLLETNEAEWPCGLQLFGHEPDVMAEAVRMTDGLGFAAFDVNMGCPVNKIVGNGEGSALMKDPELAAAIVSAMVKATKKPVTVKFRKGFDEDTVNAVEFARRMEEAGAAAVTVHGRTRVQMYAGKADWDIIRQVKEAVTIPVFGNGDIFCGADASRMKEETGCDGVAIGRGAKGNPWIIRECVAALAGEPIPGRPTRHEIRDMAKRQTEMMLPYKGEFTTIREMRKHVSWYTQGLPGSARLRDEVNRCETVEELNRLLDANLL